MEKGGLACLLAYLCCYLTGLRDFFFVYMQGERERDRQTDTICGEKGFR